MPEKYKFSDSEYKIIIESLSKDYQKKFSIKKVNLDFKIKIEEYINSFYRDLSKNKLSQNNNKPMESPFSEIDNIKALSKIEKIISELIKNIPENKYFLDNLLNLSALRGKISEKPKIGFDKKINIHEILSGLKEIKRGIPSVIEDQDRSINPEIRKKCKDILIEKLINLYFDTADVPALASVNFKQNISPRDEICKFIIQIFKLIGQKTNSRDIKNIINMTIKKKIRSQISNSLQKKSLKNNTNKRSDKPINLTLLRNNLTKNKNKKEE
ncbi:MAG: hypothetical protein CBC47_07320 [Alphaproteobacteria bacterium TMED87]|nr:hypothetical protein [Rhodospirillaceae bacterium]OUV08498.1 MAG: hypothetical protein CBC47_07320 [Alphaproteobacteria bacterium TMED87]